MLIDGAGDYGSMGHFFGEINKLTHNKKIIEILQNKSLYACLYSMQNKGLIKRIGMIYRLNKNHTPIPGKMSDKIYKQLENEENLYHMEDI